MLIYSVQGAPLKIGVGFANTGDQSIIGLDLHFKSYLGSPHGPADGDLRCDVSAFLPAGGIVPGTSFATVWDTDLERMCCTRIAGMRLTLANDTSVTA